MSHVGKPVLYRPLEAHHTTTLRGDEEFEGSLHHPEMREFAGQVTRSHDDGSHDLVIFPPNRNPVHIDRAHEGIGHGTFSLVGAPAKKSAA